MAQTSSQDEKSINIRNVVIAIGAVVLSVALFFGLKAETGLDSIEAQAQHSTSLDVALNNGQPTLVEFYADWCTTCQTMAKDLGQLKSEYGNSVNFVMLNVDNTKWLPEVIRYRVDGIPHFVFIDNQGSTVAQAIGEQPLDFLEADLDALVANLPIPYTYSPGRFSDFQSRQAILAPRQDDPRSHGAQVQ